MSVCLSVFMRMFVNNLFKKKHLLIAFHESRKQFLFTIFIYHGLSCCTQVCFLTSIYFAINPWIVVVLFRSRERYIKPKLDNKLERHINI